MKVRIIDTILVTRSKKANGFTLIELIIAIVVIGLISGSLIINYSGYIERQKLKQAALSLKQTLRLVQTKAKSGEKGSCGVQQLYGWVVRFTSETGSNPSFISYRHACGNGTVLGPKRDVLLKSGITFSSAPSEIVFQPLNKPVLSSGDIVLTNGTHSCTVSVGPTGDISDGACTP